MSYRFEIGLTKEKWNEFLQKNSQANIFQSYEFFLSQQGCNGNKPIVYCVYDDEKLLGLVLGVVYSNGGWIGKKLTSRAIIMGGPLIALDVDNKDEVLDYLLKQLKKILKGKVVYVEFRNMWDTSIYKSVFTNNGFDYEEHLDILIDLKKSEEELWSDMAKDRKKAIRKGEKELEVTPIDDSNNYQIDFIYHLLKVVYNRVKLPLPAKDFFLNVIKELYPQGYIKIFGAYKDNDLIGVRLVLCYNSMIYDWYAGADDDYLIYRPNDVLVWNILKWGGKNGYEVFDFGGAGKPNVPYGVRDYKLKFGGELVCFGRYQYVFSPAIMKLGKLAIKLKDELLKHTKR